MIKEKVLEGKYKDFSIMYDHIKNPYGDDIYFNNFSVKNMEPADQSKASYWNDSSRRVDGATSGAADKDRRLISVEWRNGENSVLQVNTTTYNRLMEAVLGRIPKEQVPDKAPAEKKSHGKTVLFLLVIVLIGIALKLFVFQ